MLVLLLFSLFIAALLSSRAPLGSASVIDVIHRSCLRACPPSVHADFLKAVVCGESLGHANGAALLRSDFAKTGLIHLLVVSGSHLICLEQLVLLLSCGFRGAREKSRWMSILIFAALFFFTLMTGASPPVLRAFLGWTLRRLSTRERWNWTRVQILTISGFATLPFCTDQWGLCSLGLSWIAGLALGFVRDTSDRPLNRQNNFSITERLHSWSSRVVILLRINVCVYVALIPALLPLGVPSLLSIFANLMFGPVMGLVLFPISLASFLWNGLVGLTDRAWSTALWLVTHAASLTPDAWEKVNLSPLWLMPYILLLTVWLVKRDRVARAVRSLTLIFLCVVSVSHVASADELIVWNIGQGSWATVKSVGLCQHFDMGGEWSPNKKISETCGSSRNEVFYSHWDWDHIGLTRTAMKLLPNLCVQAEPGGPPPNKFKAGLIQSIPHCTDASQAAEIFLSKLSTAKKEKLHDTNDFSQVFIEDQVIFPGDSPKKEEKIWRQSPLLRDARILIAGHHGSKSATSDELLSKLPHVKMIITSAHKIRYGHPHPLMLARAQKYLIPVLRTEDWGSLHFELPTKRRERLSFERRERR